MSTEKCDVNKILGCKQENWGPKIVDLKKFLFPKVLGLKNVWSKISWSEMNFLDKMFMDKTGVEPQTSGSKWFSELVSIVY